MFVEQTDGTECGKRVVDTEHGEVVAEDAFVAMCSFAERMAAVLSGKTVSIQVGNQQSVYKPEQSGLLANNAPLLEWYAEAQGAIREEMFVVGSNTTTDLLHMGQLVWKGVRDG